MCNRIIQVVFSDVDGTLLNSVRRITPRTLAAVHMLEDKNIPFVIISARSPSGVYPILREYDLKCPVICFSGALILSEKREVLWQKSFPGYRAQEVIAHLAACRFDMSVGLYSYDNWMVADKSDPRILREEQIVKAQARQMDFSALPYDFDVHKILCICSPEQTDAAEQSLKAHFPYLSVVKSSDILLEIMAGQVNKAEAVKKLCSLWAVDVQDAAAFGDNYNDVEMLETVGHGFLMGNAPEPLLKRMPCITKDNDHDGIYEVLRAIVR